MRVQCAQEHLLREVQTVSRAISSRASMPILANLLLEATPNSLRLIATDLELGIETQIDATTGEVGSITVPARIFGDIVSNLPVATVSLDVTEGDTKVRITCENIKFEILGLPAADFPSKTMAELVRVLGGIEGEVTVGSHENQLIFAVAGMRFVSRLIAGQFPPYEKVIPTEFKQRIKIGTEQFLRAVRRASITARDSANVV